MLTIIDRQLIGNYLKGYMVCLVSLLALYIVVDLFTNLDDFSHHNGGVAMTARLIGIYYGCKVWHGAGRDVHRGLDASQQRANPAPGLRRLDPAHRPPGPDQRLLDVDAERRQPGADHPQHRRQDDVPARRPRRREGDPGACTSRT
jgi:hypothetical protein